MCNFSAGVELSFEPINIEGDCIALLLPVSSSSATANVGIARSDLCSQSSSLQHGSIRNEISLGQFTDAQSLYHH